MNIEKLIDIARELDLKTEFAQLLVINSHTQENCDLTLPLVGEFDAGKTTLINALTDSKALETATKPTTATIYEIHFNADRCYATVTDADGNNTEVEDTASLKNESLANTSYINVYDTSHQVPEGIVLVDTPGLSSETPQHRQALVNFLPYAEAILLVVDVNQQLTNSLTNFVNNMKLANKPIYLVLTHCDTKSEGDIQSVLKNIALNCKIPVIQSACVSATTGDISQLTDLLKKIQGQKAEIIKKVDERRVKSISQRMIDKIDNLLSSSSTDQELDQAIKQSEIDLAKIKRQIQALKDTCQDDIDDAKRKISRAFEDDINNKLLNIVSSKAESYNDEATKAIDTTAGIYMEQFRNQLSSIIRKEAEEAASENNLSLDSLSSIKLDDLSAQGLSLDIDLDSIGHEYDSQIAFGVKAAAVAATVYLGSEALVSLDTATAAGGAAAGTGTQIAKAASQIDVDTAIDTGTFIQNMNHSHKLKKMEKNLSKMEKATKIAGEFNKGMDHANNIDKNVGKKAGQDKGIVECLVSKITDKAMGKPQRKRAVCEYVSGTLKPEFDHSLDLNAQKVVNSFSEIINQDVESTFTEKKENLKNLKQEREAKQEAFQEHVKKLKLYKDEIKTM